MAGRPIGIPERFMEGEEAELVVRLELGVAVTLVLIDKPVAGDDDEEEEVEVEKPESSALSIRLAVFFLGLPNSTACTPCANLHALFVSLSDKRVGEMFKIIIVLPSPDRQGERR